MFAYVTASYNSFFPEFCFLRLGIRIGAEHLHSWHKPKGSCKNSSSGQYKVLGKSLKVIQEKDRLRKVEIPTQMQGRKQQMDIDITNTHFCSLLLLGSENISRILLHKEAVPGFPLEIVVAKDNEFLLFQAFFLWRTLRYFFNSSADSIQDEMEFQGDPVSSTSLNFPLPNPSLCKHFLILLNKEIQDHFSLLKETH